MREWVNEPNELDFVDADTGYNCHIERHDSLKHLCGYVQIPPNHPWNGKGYDDCRMMDGSWVTVHGGLTFAGSHLKDDGQWWIGFDCAHAGDFSPGIESYLRDNRHETYKNIDYVKGELLSLCQQVKLHELAMSIAP
jgi:hypothetical protein